MIRDPAIVAGLVILGPILLINIGLFCWPRIFLYIAFRRIALERGYSFKGISLLPFKFKMGIDQNEIVFHIYGLRGAQFTAEIAVENESNIDLEIKLTDWNEKSSAYFDKKMKNPKTYVYLFAKKFVVIRSSISREEIVSLFGTYLSRVSARTSFGLFQIQVKINKVEVVGVAMPCYKPNYIYSKIFENLFSNLKNHYALDNQI